MRPADAAAVLVELTPPHRTMVMEALRATADQSRDTKPEQRLGTAPSPWLMALCQTGSRLTDHSREALTRHIEALRSNAAPASDGAAIRGLGRFGAIWRSLFDLGERA